MAQQLRKAAAAQDEIEVLTTQPNRYSTFSASALDCEAGDGIKIHRFKLPSHRSGMLDQSRSFASYARQVLKHVGLRRYDVVVSTSSRLMTAALGALVARRKSAVLYLDIRDIFVDTMAEVLSRPAALLALPALRHLERWTIRPAVRINLVSPGFAGYFSARYPQKALSFHTNGVDDEFAEASRSLVAAVSAAPSRLPITALYAGNIGAGQGLHCVLPELARSMRSRVRFRIIGDGGNKQLLERALAAADAGNVEVLPPVSRDELIAAYRAADVLFLHLNDFEAFRKVLPSKLFEYAAMGKPIWAGVAGYAAQFIREEIENAVVFTPGDAAQAEQVFGDLVLRNAPRMEFVRKYERRRIMSEMAAEILSVAAPRESARREALSRQ